ncbi:MAG: ribonuclease Z [Anaerolineales bacterium]
MFEIIFLGTSAAAPSVYRGLSSQVVSYNDKRFLIDCGEGSQRQILKSGIGFRRLNKILITHGHLDHILGLAGLLSTFSRWETIDQIEIWAGEWAMERIHDLLFGVVFPGAKPPLDIRLKIIETSPLIEDGDFRLSAFPVKHRGPGCFGFQFEELPRRPFHVDKALALGVPEGPARRDLVRGKSVTLEDGRVVTPEDVLGDPQPGARFIHVGDCGDTESLVEICQGADGLVIEATYLEYERDMAAKFGHLTAAQAARLAKRANVGQLFLTHISRRYREKEIREEAQAIFPDSTVARDFDKFEIRKLDK